MKKLTHNNFTITGLVITYIIIIIKILISYFLIEFSEIYGSLLILQESEYASFFTPEFLLVYITIHVIFLILVIAYHRHKIKSFVFIGILNTLFFSPLGGIFILIGGAMQTKETQKLETEPQIQNDFISIETKLKNLEKLFENGTITKDEYELKRKEIIDTL